MTWRLTRRQVITLTNDDQDRWRHMASLITKENAIKPQEHDRLRVKHWLVACSASMMTSSNGKIFRVTGPLWGESTGHRWIPFTKASDSGALMFSLICTWTNSWANHRDAGDLRRHGVYYDVTVITKPLPYQTEVFSIEPSETDLWIKMCTFSLNDLHLKMSCTKCQLLFCRKAKVIAQINHE